jgi:predicted small lipoprotein YifL
VTRPRAKTAEDGQRPQRLHASPLRSVFLATTILLCGLCASACGKKGPPLPPLVKLPVAPPEIVAQRRGDTVDVQFVVPSTNTDGSRPANVASAEVYAITVPPTAAPPQYTDAQLLKYGTKIAAVPVKAPKDPDLTADPDEPADEVDEPEGAGLDQGAMAHVSEPLTRDLLKPVDVPRDPQSQPPGADRWSAPRTVAGAGRADLRRRRRLDARPPRAGVQARDRAAGPAAASSGLGAFDRLR